MKDFFGQELSIGDSVAVPPKNYRGLVKARIIAVTPQNIRVKYANPYEQEYLVPPGSVIRCPEEMQ